MCLKEGQKKGMGRENGPVLRDAPREPETIIGRGTPSQFIDNNQ